MTPNVARYVFAQVFETGFKENMNEEEAVELVKQAILAGVFNDLGSGSNVDVTVIKSGGETSRWDWGGRQWGIASLRQFCCHY